MTKILHIRKELNMKKTLYINGEEKPNSSGVYNAIWHVLKELGVSFESDLSKFKTTARRELQHPGKYTLGGFCYEDGTPIQIEYSIVTGKKSMIDLIFYWSVLAPTETTRPSYLVEITKNGFPEAGNMSDQRAAKPIEAWDQPGWSGVPYLYLVNMIVWSEPNNSHARALRRMEILGAKIAYSIEGEVGVTEIDLPERVKQIKTTADLVKEDLFNRRSPTRFTLNQEENKFTFTVPLWKSGNPKETSDPNVGLVASTVHSALSLGYSGDFFIEKHEKSLEYFNGNNKLARILSLAVARGHKVFVEGIEDPLNPRADSDVYFKAEHNGEKLASIALEGRNIQNGPWETIFDNHAGCEKSYFKDAAGEYKPVPKTFNPKKRKDLEELGLPLAWEGEKLGLPDLVMKNEKEGRIIVVEGEMSENLFANKKGYDQVEEGKFRKTVKWMAAHYPEYTVEVHMATFGKDTGENILYHLNKDGSEVYNGDAKPVYVVGPLRGKEELNEIYWQQNETINLSARVNC